MAKTINLRWMIKEPNKPLEERNFDISYKNADDRSSKELKLAQELVKGYVEVVWVGGEVKALVNEEAMYDPNMEHNCGFLGTVVFIREVIERDDARWGSLTDDDVKKIKAWAVAHGNDMHPGDVGVRVLTGEDADSFRKTLHEGQKRRQVEWESF